MGFGRGNTMTADGYSGGDGSGRVAVMVADAEDISSVIVLILLCR